MKKRAKATTWQEIKRSLITGILVIGPLVVTLFLLWKSFLFIDGILSTVVNRSLSYVFHLDFLRNYSIPGLGFITLLIVLLFAGYATRLVGPQWVTLKIQKIISQIPLVNRIYKAVQQISEALLSGRQEVFKKAVLIQYPRKGVYSIAIMTADTSGIIQDNLEEDSLSVFLPTTPNPTSGFLLFVPKSEIIELSIPVEDALKLIISGGTLNYNADNLTFEESDSSK